MQLAGCRPARTGFVPRIAPRTGDKLIRVHLMSFLTTAHPPIPIQSGALEGREGDPYGTGGTRPPNIWTGGIITNAPLNISGVISATFYPCNIFLIS